MPKAPASAPQTAPTIPERAPRHVIPFRAVSRGAHWFPECTPKPRKPWRIVPLLDDLETMRARG